MDQVIDRKGFVGDAFADVTAVPLADYRGGPALLLAETDDPSAVAAHFGTLDLIVIPFASHADGRGFSLAGVLRALGYGGHLRARGHILVDQFRAALRAGFDDIQISADLAARSPAHHWQAVPLTTGYRARVFGQGHAPL